MLCRAAGEGCSTCTQTPGKLISETPIKVQLFGAPGAAPGTSPSVIPKLTSSFFSFRAPCLLCIKEKDRQNQYCRVQVLV